MGRPKKGANSARTKASAKYKNEGRRSENKLKKQKMIEAGKTPKNPRRLKHKTEDLLFDDAERKMFFEYDPAEEKKALKEGRVYLKPKNVNKTCL